MIRLKTMIIVAIDGYSSCGKSSYAKLIAQELAYLYLDSGAMYRAVAYYGLKNGFIHQGEISKKELIRNLKYIHIAFNYVAGENTTYLNNENIERVIRDSEVSSVVSAISQIPEIREHLVYLQQGMGKSKGIVMDGRDIGTVVFPEAEVKIFMKANAEVRAKRRYDELIGKGMKADFDVIINNIQERDYLDMNRAVSPLRQAEDAYVLDNSKMSFSEQMDWFKTILKEKNLIKE